MIYTLQGWLDAGKPLDSIINADCLELLPHIDDGSVDLVLTDPPYGIGISKNPFRQKHEKSDWDNKTPDDSLINQYFRISTNQIIFGGNYFKLPPSQGFIIWDKGQPESFSSSMCEYAWSSIQSPAKVFYLRPMEEQPKYHPTQKPLALMEWILNKYSEQSQLICDPFLGSGTTAVACKKLGRHYIGIELSREYCEIAEQRLSKVTGGITPKLTEKEWF